MLQQPPRNLVWFFWSALAAALALYGMFFARDERISDEEFKCRHLAGMMDQKECARTLRPQTKGAP
jgi:hypothetical protein